MESDGVGMLGFAGSPPTYDSYFRRFMIKRIIFKGRIMNAKCRMLFVGVLFRILDYRNKNGG